MQNYQKIEKKVLKNSLYIFTGVALILGIISLLLNLPALIIGAVVGFAVSLTGYYFTVKAIDSTFEYKASFFIPAVYFFKLSIYAGAMIAATQSNWINLWSLFGCLFIIKMSTYIAELGGKQNG